MSQTVDVTKIMQEIEQKAKEQKENIGLTVAFQPISKNKADYNMLESFAPKEYQELDVNAKIVLERPVTGNIFARFIKKLQRKLTRAYIAPVVFEQNHFNDHILYGINSLRIDEAETQRRLYETQLEIYELQNTKIEDNDLNKLSQFVHRDMQKENNRLQKQCEELAAQNLELKDKVEKIEAYLSTVAK